MTDQNLATGTTLKAQINDITNVQAANATSGAKVQIIVTDSLGKTILATEAQLRNTLTDNTYNTIAATALASVNSSLASRKSTLQTSFTNL